MTCRDTPGIPDVTVMILFMHSLVFVRVLCFVFQRYVIDLCYDTANSIELLLLLVSLCSFLFFSFVYRISGIASNSKLCLFASHLFALLILVQGMDRLFRARRNGIRY